MDPRPPEPFDDAAELIFRRLREDEVQGEMVLPHGIEIPACSFDRERHCKDPAETLQRGGPEYTRVAWCASGSVATPHEFNGVPYRFHLEHCPEPDNRAHSEVRLVRCADDKTTKPGSTDAKREARSALARKLKVYPQGRVQRARPPVAIAPLNLD